MYYTYKQKNELAATEDKTLPYCPVIKIIFSAIIIVMLSASALMAQKTYSLDKNHARVGFSVVHFGISHIEGNFKIIDATLDSKKADFTDAAISFTADVHSINTEVTYRDNDLKSANYFDADKFPSINFISTSFKKLSGKNYKLFGNITIHGITKSIALNVVYNGQAVTAMKKPTAGFTIKGQLNRLDFGVGGPVLSGVGNEIELRANMEFTISE